MIVEKLWTGLRDVIMLSFSFSKKNKKIAKSRVLRNIKPYGKWKSNININNNSHYKNNNNHNNSNNESNNYLNEIWNFSMNNYSSVLSATFQSWLCSIALFTWALFKQGLLEGSIIILYYINTAWYMALCRS